ncbi:hypothetical protein GGX14DRAFT_580227 [Mycena pura]|uniref:Uncharacterized protein n=1 Tax=Mycena pura TaxID=153505 RepID=A0AAD6UN13_9AGAR|nr:hypothetical protein GGX14DRAFT_580227 [Mycena pura]
MPPLKKHLRTHINNVGNGIKHAFQSLSPRKRRKTSDGDDEGKENKASTLPSDLCMDASNALYAPDASLADPISPDVFLATCSPPAGNLPSGHFPTNHGMYFYQNTRPAVPTCAPTQSYHEYTLPPPPAPKSCRPTVEEVPDEDDVSFLTWLHENNSLDSVNSSPAQPDPEEAAFDCAAAADLAAQDQYAKIYDPYVGPGRLREAPSISQATEAVHDLKKLLRGESPGVAGGYKDPGHDPFVRFRLEGMQILLNLFINPRSKTHGHWGASALQAAVGLGRGTHCVRTLCKLARQFIHDRTLLPINPYGAWKESLLADEDLKNNINLHLQENGNHITAEKTCPVSLAARDHAEARYRQDHLDSHSTALFACPRL